VARTLIKNGSIVTASDEYVGDVLVDGETIAAVGRNLEATAEKTIDATGLYVLPGGVDGHTHFCLPFGGTETAGFETTVGAIVGGTTTILDFAPQPPGYSLVDAVAKHNAERAEGKAVVDYGLHAMVMESTEAVLEEIPALPEAGIPTMKLFMAYKGTPFMVDDDMMFRALQRAKDVGLLVMVHAENGDVIDALQRQLIARGCVDPKYHAASRPPAVEAEATARALTLAAIADAPIFIVHVSCTEAMEAIRAAKQKGQPVFGETCPHYLTLGVENLAKPGFEGAKYVCSPALREHWHHDMLWQGLRSGTLQVVGSDHCGFNYQGQKELGRGDFRKIPNGAPGVENRLAILYTYGVVEKKLSLNRLVDVFATSPAKFYGLYPRKGSIVAGGDADLVLFDPDYEGTITVATQSQGLDYSPYEGCRQVGRVRQVFLRGALSVDDGVFVGEKGQGMYLKREAYGLAYM
jgi:dihydropyrimidinase